MSAVVNEMIWNRVIRFPITFIYWNTSLVCFIYSSVSVSDHVGWEAFGTYRSIERQCFSTLFTYNHIETSNRTASLDIDAFYLEFKKLLSIKYQSKMLFHANEVRYLQTRNELSCIVTFTIMRPVKKTTTAYIGTGENSTLNTAKFGVALEGKLWWEFA